MNQRQVDLLETLFTSTTFVTAKSLSQKFQVSKKTIYKDYDVLLKFLKNTGVDLIKKRHNGVRIVGSNEDKRSILNDLKMKNPSQLGDDNYSPENRRIYIVKKVILDGEKETLKNLSAKWLVSKTSILNDLEVINRIIDASLGQLTSNNLYIELQGDEEQRQAAVSRFLVSELNKRPDLKDDQDNLLEAFFSFEIVDSVSEIFNSFKRYWFLGIPKYYLFALKILMMVQVYRLKQGKYFTKQNMDDQMKDDEGYQIAEYALSKISKQLGFNYYIADIERFYLNLSTYRVGVENNEISSNWDSIIEKLIDRMESIQKVNFLGKAQLKNQLLYHVPAMILRLKRGMIVRNPLLKDIKQHYSALFGMTWYSLSFLEDEFAITLNDDEVSFITIYFHIALNKIAPNDKILILFEKHSQLHEYVEAQIEQLLPANTRISSISADELKNTNIEEIKLVIAVDVTGIILDKPVVYVNSLMDSKSQADILTSYAEKVILLNETQEEAHFPTLKKIISEDLIFWKESFVSKDEALDFLISKLEKRKIVNSSFRNSIYQRERMGSTEMEGGAALPHAAPETVKETAIAILILQKPIWWNSQNVFLIILSCVPESQVKIYRDLILDIYGLVQNKEIVQMITNIKDTEKFVSLIGH